MKKKFSGRQSRFANLGYSLSAGCRSFLLLLAFMAAALTGRAQTAVINDAYWTYQQDCNGDGAVAGTLGGNKARLSWDPAVANCNGTLTVFEKVYYKDCAGSTWTPIFTNGTHTIVACRSGNQQHVDLTLAAGNTCRDYKIEIYRNGQGSPDYVRSGTNDVQLSQHREELLAEDFCLSDYFESCAALNGPYGSQSDNNATATKEPGEPNHAGNSGGHSLWYCWTATTNKPVTFDTIGSTFDTLLAVYTGNSVSGLTLVTNSDDIAGATNRLSKLTFTPVAGVTYHIAVDGFGGATGIINLNWNQTGSALPDLIIWGPAANPKVYTRTFTNGDCEVVEGCETAGTHTLLGFTTETRNIGAGDLVMGNPATNSLFVWASCHAHYHFEQFAEYNLLGTNGNIVATGHKVGFCLEDVSKWSPTAGPLKYDCNNQGIQAGWADIYGGIDYIPGFGGLACQYIDVTGVPPGDYVLQITVNPDNIFPESNTANNTTLVPVNIPPVSCTNTPPNDNFANAIVVTNLPFTYLEFNKCATAQSGEPAHAYNTASHTVWFNWTPASNQTAVINTRRSDFDTVLAVYTGNALNSLTRVATNDDIVSGVNLQSQVTFAAVAGTTYRIAVDGYGGAVGNLSLNLMPPANDDMTNGFVLTGTGGTTNASNISASKEPYESAHAGDVGGHSIWYRWTAPRSGPVDFNTLGSDFDTTLAVYTGNVVSNMTVIASNDEDAEQGGLVTSRLWFTAVQGTTYRIAVDGFGGDSGNVVLNWNMDSELSISQAPDGDIQVFLTGVDWQRYVLLESTNFVNWTTNTAAITMAEGLHTYTNIPTSSRAILRSMRVP